MALAFVAAAWIWCAHAEANGTEIFTGEAISLELVDAQLSDVIGALSGGTDFVFAVDAQTIAHGGLDRSVTAVFDSVPWDRALDEILTEAGLEWTLEGQVLWIHLPAYRPDGDRNFTGDPIRLRLKDAQIRDVLPTFSKITGMEIDLDADVSGLLSLSLNDVPWDQTFDFILRISGLGSARSGDAIRVFRISDARGMQFLPPGGP